MRSTASRAPTRPAGGSLFLAWGKIQGVSGGARDFCGFLVSNCFFFFGIFVGFICQI